MADIFPLPCISFITMIQKTNDLLGTSTARLLSDVGKALGQAKSDLDELQGPSEEIKPGIFVQKKCPFADTVEVYKAIGLDVPAAISEVASQAPQFGTVWVSAYCGVHQAMRQAKNEKIFQIACKAGDGSIRYAENDAVDEAEAKELLKNAVCLYGVK
ncbi:MAG: hypothetical protein PVH29_11295 [Candidatus Zixiibacteriota bacterium]|jgi:hypothetical protein